MISLNFKNIKKSFPFKNDLRLYQKKVIFVKLKLSKFGIIRFFCFV